MLGELTMLSVKRTRQKKDFINFKLKDNANEHNRSTK